MRIAIYGGKFDPPHLAHQMALFLLLSKYKLHRIYIVPSSQHPFGYDMCSFGERVEMCQQIASQFNEFWRSKVIQKNVVQVLRIEEDMISPIHSINVVKKIIEQDFALYKDIELEHYFVIGSDNWDNSYSWQNFEQIKKLTKLIVFGRGQYTNNDNYIMLPNISSTEIRGRIRTGRDINSLVPNSVAKYIKENNLYR